MPTRPKRPKLRKRQLAPLDNANGKAAAQWFEDFNRDEGNELKLGVAEAGQPSGENGEADRLLLATRSLPGYADALASARNALPALCGRTRMVRELHLADTTHGDGGKEFASNVLLSLASYGHVNHDRAVDYGCALGDAERWHESNGTRRQFVRNLTARQANAARKSLPNLKPPFGDVPAVPLAVVCLWVFAGLWLASEEDAAAVLHRQELKPGRGKRTVKVTGDYIRRVVSDLKLVRYEGAGRFVFHDADGGLLADAKLLEELKAAAKRND